MTRHATTLLHTDDVRVIDVRCSCAAGSVDEERTAGFEVVFPTSGTYRRQGDVVDAATVYVGTPATEQRIEHITDGDRCIAVLLSDRLADELDLDRRALARTPFHDGVVARARRGVDEETWLHALAPVSTRPAVVNDAHRRAVQRVREAIAADPGAPWRLRTLAGIAGYAPHHLSRVFRRATGNTITEHRDRVRLARAAELAADGMRLADVAATLGFADHGHLTRRARHVLGVVPSELRP